MKNKLHFLAVLCAGLVINASAADTETAPKENTSPPNRSASKSPSKWTALTWSRRISKSSACSNTNRTATRTRGPPKRPMKKLGGILSSLRNRGEFIGESGETVLLRRPRFNPASGFMVIGLGRKRSSCSHVHATCLLNSDGLAAEAVGWRPTRAQMSTGTDLFPPQGRSHEPLAGMNPWARKEDGFTTFADEFTAISQRERMPPSFSSVSWRPLVVFAVRFVFEQSR